MSDTPKYLPESRELFRKFMSAHFSDYFDHMRETRVGPGSGYWFFYRSNEVIQHLRDIVHNLEDTFGGVTIPGKFSSPKKLVEAWNWFYVFLKNKNELFEDVLNATKDKSDRLPDPFFWVHKIHQDTLALMEEIISTNEVKEFLPKEIEMKRSSEEESTKSQKFDVAIITALHDTEFEALKNIPVKITPYPVADDSTAYYDCKIGKLSVLLATDDKMGMAASAALSTKIIAKFSPKYLIMAGIAGGVKDKEKNYGDVLIARYTWNYDSGKYKYNIKSKASVFEPNPEQLELSEDIVKIINELKSDTDLLKNIEAGYTSTPPKDIKPDKPLKIILGPVASGSAVLADEQKVEDLRRANRKLIGIDMETFGVFYSAKKFSSKESTVAISIKSISDFADQRKSDKYRKYAAYTSVQFIYQLILLKLQ